MTHGERLLSLIRERVPDVTVGAEVGVFRGETSACLLRGLPGMRLYLVDCWDAGWTLQPRNQFMRMAERKDQAWHEDNLRQTREAVGFAGERAMIVKADFRDAVYHIQEQLDFVFLDASHSYQDTYDQIRYYRPLVRSGGLVCGHDYRNPNPGYGVTTQAVDDYAARHGLTVGCDEATYLWWLE